MRWIPPTGTMSAFSWSDAMVLWIEVNRLKIPVPLAGVYVRPLLREYGKMDEESARRIWLLFKRTARNFPGLTLVEAEEAGGERVVIRLSGR